MPVTDTLVTLVQKLVVRDVVGINVLLDLSKGPVGKWVDLDKSRLVNLNNVKVTTLSALTPSSTSENSLDLEIRVSPLSRLDLGNVVVEFVVGLPELVAVLQSEFVDIVAASRLVNMDRGSISPPDAVNKSVGLIEVVEGVQEDQVDVVIQRAFNLGEHIHGDQTSKTKGCGLEEPRERCDAPFEDV